MRSLTSLKSSLGTVEVVKILKDIRELYEAEVAEKNVFFTVEIHPELSGSLVVCTDAIKYRQIALNILSNAVKYTQKGHISLGLKLLEKGIPVPGSRGQDRYFEQRVLALTVSDTGPGMSSEDSERIFEPFEQASNRLAKLLANVLDGDLELESVLGIGSRFTFWIPYREASDSMKDQELDSIRVKTSTDEAG